MTPFKYAKAVTPNNGADNILNAGGAACKSRGIIVTVTGTLSFLDAKGGTNIINAVAGVVYPIETKRILATGTTATGIYAGW